MLSAAVLASGADDPPGTTTTTTTTTTTPATIPAGVTIAGVAVGGMTREAAVAAVQAAFAAPLPIVVAGHHLAPTPSALGSSIAAQRAVDSAQHAAAGTSIQVLLTVRLERLRAYVATVAKRFDPRRMTIAAPKSLRVTACSCFFERRASSVRRFWSSAAEIARTAAGRSSTRPGAPLLMNGRRWRSTSCESCGGRSKRFATVAT